MSRKEKPDEKILFLIGGILIGGFVSMFLVTFLHEPDRDDSITFSRDIGENLIRHRLGINDLSETIIFFDNGTYCEYINNLAFTNHSYMHIVINGTRIMEKWIE